MSPRSRKLISAVAAVGCLAAALAVTVIAPAASRGGSGEADRIVGTAKADRLSGGRGADTIKGKGGDDRISGGRGRDKLVGGRGHDSIRGGRGRDKVKVADGSLDAVECGAGRRDKVVGDADLDVASGCERGATQLANFASGVDVSIEGHYLRIQSNGIPDHRTGDFPNASNPNSIREQDYDYLLPIDPHKADEPTETGMGPIGITLSGAVFYNPYNAGGMDAVVTETFDSCEGHPDQRGAYHYHHYSPCIYDDGVGHSEIWGYAFDGFAVYGPDGVGGSEPTDLDSCNGHSHGKLGYHYHATTDEPYLIGCYSGTPTVSTQGPPSGPPLSAGLAGGLLAVPLCLLGGVALILRRRPAAA